MYLLDLFGQLVDLLLLRGDELLEIGDLALLVSNLAAFVVIASLDRVHVFG
jgi:hypothetical protein